MNPTQTMISADELWKMPHDGMRRELLRGEVRTMSPAGSEHGSIVVEVTIPLGNHVKAHKLGRVFGAETGFKIGSNPDSVLAPDVAFVRQERIPSSGIPRAYWPGAPDLVVEVVSPGDTAEEVDDKVAEWISAGVKAVWVVKPKRRTVTVHNAGKPEVLLTIDDEIDGGEVVPGFRYPVADFFPE